MTKEELQIKEEELLKTLNEEDKELEDLFRFVIRTKSGIKAEVTLTRNYWEKSIYLKVGVPYNDRILDVSVYFSNKTQYNRETQQREAAEDSKMMEINYGSYGTHSRLSYGGKLKELDILIGELWKMENDLTEIYNKIDWTNEELYNEVTCEIRKIVDEEKYIEWENERKKEKEKLNKVIDTFHVGMKIYTYWEGNDVVIENITNNYVYLNIPYSFTSYRRNKKKIRFEKEELAREIIRRDNL